MRFGIIGDDDTGSSDAASMLTAAGVRTALITKIDKWKDRREDLKAYDAIVVGTQARSVAPATARKRVRLALDFLKPFRPDIVQIKYCSTFDSTPKGNIGPTIDIAMDVTRASATIVCPALPVNGRTVYMGHLFVGQTLLSESPLRNHPLNPMTDANIVRWLQHQTKRTVDLVPQDVIRQGVAKTKQYIKGLIKNGASYLVTDAATQSDLTVLAQCVKDWPLISGGSGITAELAPQLFPDATPLDYSKRIRTLPGGMLVVSGSQSPATASQNAHAADSGFAVLPVDPYAVIDGQFEPKQLIKQAQNYLKADQPVLIRSGSGRKKDASTVVQQYAGEKSLSTTQLGRKIEQALGHITKRLVDSGLVGRLVVSGGETSGHVCKTLGISAFEAGLPVDPGVPYCFPLDRPHILITLKSGNFGSPDFYTRVHSLQ
jgi:3-dehydrotetronate 4-kinase